MSFHRKYSILSLKKRVKKGRMGYADIIIYYSDVCDIWETSDFWNQGFVGNRKNFTYCGTFTGCSYRSGSGRICIHSNSDIGDCRSGCFVFESIAMVMMTFMEMFTLSAALFCNVKIEGKRFFCWSNSKELLFFYKKKEFMIRNVGQDEDSLGIWNDL